MAGTGLNETVRRPSPEQIAESNRLLSLWKKTSERTLESLGVMASRGWNYRTEGNRILVED